MYVQERQKAKKAAEKAAADEASGSVTPQQEAQLSGGECATLLLNDTYVWPQENHRVLF